MYIQATLGAEIFGEDKCSEESYHAGEEDDFADKGEQSKFKAGAFAATASAVIKSQQYIFSIFFIVLLLLHFQSCMIMVMDT